MPVFNDSEYAVHHGDCIPHMLSEMPESCVDFSVFSPPFPALYAYTDSVSDIGNVDFSFVGWLACLSQVVRQ